MFRRVAYLAVPILILATAVAGCASFRLEPRGAWRAEAERACMAERPFRHDDFITRIGSIREHLVCGLTRPLEVRAFNDGTVAVTPTATMGCPLAVALESWLAGAVQPSARARLGTTVVGIREFSSYSCRPVNNQAGGSPSEHAFGNALDIAAFELADGRVVSVEGDWHGGTQAERDFLREIHAAACQYFTTVLGPGYPLHDDHFHVDLAQRSSVVCRPAPTVPPLRTADAPAGGATDAPLAYADEEAGATMLDLATVGGIGGLIQALGR